MPDFAPLHVVPALSSAPATAVLRPVGTSVALLDGGAAAFPRMLEAIGQSRATIHIEVYAFASDSVGEQFIEALSSAAARGVHVHVVMDGWGSLLSGNYVASALRAAGCDVNIYHRLLSTLLGNWRRNHRKILVVDDRLAFLGGINIGDEYATDRNRPGWADLALEVQGEVCATLGARLRGEHPPAILSDVRIHLSSFGGGRGMRKRYLKAIGRARREVLIAHAYFLPDHRFVRSLRAAARRGVRVSLLLAGRSDVPFAHAATMRLYLQLIQAGVRIFEWGDSVLHAKAAVVDSEVALVGSFNLDPLSLTNLESLVEVDHAGTASEVAAWIGKRIQLSPEIGLAACQRAPLQRWVLDRIGLWTARLTEWFARAMSLRRS